MEYYVINKKGEHVELDFNRVLFRLLELKNMKPKLNVNVPLIAQNTIKMMVNGISTKELDEISVKFCASMITNDLDYDKMAVRLTVDNLHRETKDCFLKTITNIENYLVDGNKINILHFKLIKFVNRYYLRINEIFDFSMDYKYTYFGIKTLMKSYLLKHSAGEYYNIKERPQHMLMRVSIGLNINSINENGEASESTIESIFDTYKLMSKKYYTHATPTLFNSGTHRQAMSSCFLLSVDDSLSNIYKTLTDTAMISKWSGGVGIHVSQVRAMNSIIKSTNGKSEGVVPMLKMYNDSAVYVSQGGGKRKGSTAVYLETWHSDIFDFLDLKKPVGDESRRARDLFLALWICDLFMERLEKAIHTGEEVMWSLFCPSKAKGLADVYGEEYKKLYLKYENDKIWNSQVSITKLWTHILEVQMESGIPYISYKDHVNRKSNQNNLGTIKSSNLCVHGDTLILTDNGYNKIKDLEGKNVNVWNGEQFSETTVHLTGTGKELLKLNFSNGASMRCTPYHKFFIQKEGKEIKVEAKDLQKYDKISKCDYPTIDVRNNNEDINIAYTSGYYMSNNKNGCIVSYHSKNILNHVLKYKSSIIDKHNNKWYSMYKEVINEQSPPVNKSIKYKTEWLTGFIDGCGVISSNKQVFTTHLINSNITLLNNVRMLCNTMGMNPRVSGEKLLFSVKDTIYMYKELKINPYIICYNGRFTKFLFNNIADVKEPYIYVKSIENIDGLHNTYCFNEKLKHRGVFNGVLAGNCVDADTLILTDTGYHKIKELSGRNVNIWDSEKFIEAPVFKTGESQKMMKVYTTDGCELECTEYHRFKLKNDNKDKRRNNKSDIIKRAHELKVGDKLIKSDYPVIDGTDKNMLYPYTHGFYCGDGTDSNYLTNKNKRQYAFIDLYGEKQKLKDKLEYTKEYTVCANKIRYKLHNDIDLKFTTPSDNSSLDNKLKWLSGLLDADGCLVTCSKKTNTQCVQIASIHKDFLMKVKLLCNTLGCNPVIKEFKPEEQRSLPANDGTGNSKMFNCRKALRMSFSSNDTYKLYELGLKTYRLEYKYVKPSQNVKRYVEVLKTEIMAELKDTYCLKSKDTETAIFNGIPCLNCNEINIYTDKDNIGVCNLASICLSKFVEKRIDNDGIPEKFYNYTKLHSICKTAIYNLNKVIDNNVYPVKEGEYADSKNRPVGLGVQSLAKVFFKMGIPFVCDKSKEINKKIFETMYHASVEASCELAKEHGVYETYSTSMMAKGILQPDLWGVTPSDLWDWSELRNNIKKYGVRNSLLLALMPTASTAQIMGNTESFEPISSNIFVRNTLSGTFQVVNKYLVRDLKKLNLWNDEMKQRIIAMDGSIQHINNISKDIKQKYLTVWEIKQKDLIDLEADRNCYVCQSTSSNRYLKNPDNAKLTSMHMYAWKKGLKTGMYYLRSQSAVNAVKFNVDTQILKEQNEIYNNTMEEECLMCSA